MRLILLSLTTYFALLTAIWSYQQGIWYGTIITVILTLIQIGFVHYSRSIE